MTTMQAFAKLLDEIEERVRPTVCDTFSSTVHPQYFKLRREGRISEVDLNTIKIIADTLRKP